MIRPEWIKELKQYANPDTLKSMIQVINTVVPYLILLLTLMVLMKMKAPYFIILLLIPVVSCFFVRMFVLFHDCAHLSFLNSKKANNIIGHLLGILCFTSLFSWRRSHLIHHGTVGNLGKRGVGDVNTLTTNEYLKLTKLKKFLYRIYRNPVTLFLFAPFYIFILLQRFPDRLSRKKEVISIIVTNIFIFMIIITAYYTIGIKIYLAVQLPVFCIAGSFGVWLFYIQHQFENVYWEDSDNWNIYKASFEGSSHYKMPGILRWVTANIGVHNVHHLNAKIPNYNLEECYKRIPELSRITPFKIMYGFKVISLNLWDEKSRKLVSFSNFTSK